MKRIFCLVSAILLSACNDNQNTVDVVVSTVNDNVIENNTYQVKPIDTPTTFDSYSWIQTCGTPILKDDEKYSLSFDFVAPELDQDEKFCFEFTGDVDGKRYVTQTNLTVVAPTLEVYVDHASLPSLQQLMKIIQQKNEYSQNERFISWGRIGLTEDNAEKLNAHIYPLAGNNTSQELVDAVIDYADSKNRLNLELNTNTAHSFPNLAPILRIISSKSNILISNINLYDDGSAEYVNLYNWKDTEDKSVKLSDSFLVLKDYFNGISSEKPSGIYGRYNWHQLYNTSYYFLRKDYLTVEPQLHDLREYLGGSLKQMSWDGFSQLSKGDKELFLNIVGFDQEKLQQEYQQSELPNFVFTGTTTWAGGETKEYYAQQQVNVVNNAINETSPYYLGREHDLFFKGHPRGGIINDIILGSFNNMIDIPAKVSFEVLMMTGMLPDTVGGIASSLYFSIPAEKVSFIVFTSSDTITDREDALKSPLVQVMMTLGIVKEKDVLFWSDLPDCSSGVCIAQY
uniref:Alpha-2,6-sialyltransferase n=1 Tax=Photobacterium leiognathi TaxID=553611 RepID=D0VYB7_PHOLE|nr:alpha-2,6-sialyltransferase [Photobacterium leiognathi]